MTAERRREAEFSRPLAVDRLGSDRDSISAGRLDIDIEAAPAECRAVAARLMIPDVLALACRFALWREPGRIVAEGALSARVVRDCVVTLEPFEDGMCEHFRVHFVPEGAETEDDDPLAPDQIAYTGGFIDLGEAAVEQLALALDPYPRRPGAVLDQPDEPAAPAGETRQAFAALERWRKSSPAED